VPILKQPMLGIASTLLVMVVSFGFITFFDGHTFTGWVSYYLMCTIPMSLVICIMWHGQLPAFAAGRRQPMRGAVFLLMALAVGAVVAALQSVTVGGGIDPPSPVLIQSTIASVIVAFWMTFIWGGWPFTLIRNPLVAGFSLLIGCYAVSYVVFHLFFNYEFLRGSPIYVADLDPNGLFDGWSATVFCITTGGAMFLMLHFDLWPLTRVPALMRQPVLGLVWNGIVVILAAIVVTVGTGVLGMAPPELLTTVTIPFIFGSIVLLNTLDGSLFARLPQPVKGICSALAAAAIGTVLTLVYGALAPVLTGPVPAGPPEYAYEVWLASAMLAVAFPFLAYFNDFFQLWPLAGRRKRQDQDTDEPQRRSTAPSNLGEPA
jgi:hypothetical protein